MSLTSCNNSNDKILNYILYLPLKICLNSIGRCRKTIILTFEIEKTMAQSQERRHSFSSVVFDDFCN